MPPAYLKAPQIEVIQRCTKVPHESRKIAQDHLRKFGVKKVNTNIVQSSGDKGIMTVYRCRFCRKWHLGHIQYPKPKKKRSIPMNEQIAGSKNPATGESYQPKQIREETVQERRWNELQAEYAKKAAEQYYQEFPEDDPNYVPDQAQGEQQPVIDGGEESGTGYVTKTYADGTEVSAPVLPEEPLPDQSPAEQDAADEAKQENPDVHSEPPLGEEPREVTPGTEPAEPQNNTQE